MRGHATGRHRVVLHPVDADGRLDGGNQHDHARLRHDQSVSGTARLTFARSTPTVRIMAEAGLFIGWGQTVRGREAKGLQVFDEGVEFWRRQQASGAIESFEVVFLAPHGGDLAGFLLVRGSYEQIAAVRANAEFQRINARPRPCVDGLGIIDATLDDGLEPAIETFRAVIAELA